MLCRRPIGQFRSASPDWDVRFQITLAEHEPAPEELLEPAGPAKDVHSVCKSSCPDLRPKALQPPKPECSGTICLGNCLLDDRCLLSRTEVAVSLMCLFLHHKDHRKAVRSGMLHHNCDCPAQVIFSTIQKRQEVLH